MKAKIQQSQISVFSEYVNLMKTEKNLSVTKVKNSMKRRIHKGRSLLVNYLQHSSS